VEPFERDVMKIITPSDDGISLVRKIFLKPHRPDDILVKINSHAFSLCAFIHLYTHTYSLWVM
jgi:hypothetical protein